MKVEINTEQYDCTGGLLKTMKERTLKEWDELYHDAVSKRASIDERVKRRYELYTGTDRVRDLQKGGY